MVETRTARFSLPQYSAGTDSAFSRADSNEAFGNIEARAAYDDGTTNAALPVTNVLPGRYFRRSHADGYSLHRVNGGGWEWMGGTIVPTGTIVRHRTTGDGDTALIIDQGAGATRMTVFGSGEIASESIMRGMAGTFGANLDMPIDLSLVGRLFAQTRGDGERALVVRPHAPTAGYLFTAQDAGGSDVTSIDSLGRFSQRSISAFGAAAVGTTAAVTVAPPATDADAVVVGLLAHGQVGGAGREAKSIVRVLRDITDTAPILDATRDRVTVGRLPWATAGSATTGVITQAANRHIARASGASTVYAQWRRSDTSSPPNELNTANDTVLMGLGNDGLSTRMPVSLIQREAYTAPALLIERYNDFTANFLNVNRRVLSGGVETQQAAATLDSTGRLAAGAWWKGTGTLRDARQPVMHLSSKRYASVEDNYLTAGWLVQPNTTVGYTWPTWTVYSGTATDLAIIVNCEAILIPGSVDEDSQLISLITDIKIGSGGFNQIDYTSATTTTAGTKNGYRPGGNTWSTLSYAFNIPAGSTFTLVTRIYVSNSAPTVRIRKLEVQATEAIVDYIAGA